MNIEEKRLSCGDGGPTGIEIARGSAELAVADDFTKAYCVADSWPEAETLVEDQATRLWARARAEVQRDRGPKEDRHLYWARLQMTRAIQAHRPGWAKDLPSADWVHISPKFRRVLEDASRGIRPWPAPGEPVPARILVTGFDPFGLGIDIRQSNPSGAAVLDLIGTELGSGANTTLIDGAIFPVRFHDFNAGIVERLLLGRLGVHPGPAFIVTVSQGGTDFTLERFAGRRRASGAFADNRGHTCGADAGKTAIAPKMPEGPEFLETTAPDSLIAAMAAGPTGQGEHRIPVRIGTDVIGRANGADQRLHGATAIARKMTAVEGSGGGFLSNELYYRTLNLLANSGTRIPAIHLHTPKLVFDRSEDVTPPQMRARRLNIVAGVREILLRALTWLSPT